MNDSRGPFRRILKLESAWDTGKDWTLVYFECGHVGQLNPIRNYETEKELRCFQCGQNNP
jgi:hypothetical protein